MRKYSRALIALIVAVSLVTPVLLSAEQLAAPLDKKLSPGTTPVQYAGQTFVFTTNILLRVKFQMVNSTQFELNVTALNYTPGAAGPGGPAVSIFWDDNNDQIYDGDPTSAGWTGVIDTEGGWTEK